MVYVYRKSGLSAIIAVINVTEKYFRMFGSLEDEYFRERLLDIQDVQKGYTEILLG